MPQLIVKFKNELSYDHMFRLNLLKFLLDMHIEIVKTVKNLYLR